MDNSLKISMGGGYKPAPDIIAIKARFYAENHFHRPLTALRPPQRVPTAYCLNFYFEFPTADIAALLGVSCSTVLRDLQSASVYKNTQAFMSRVQSLYEYILYNAKYIP